MKQGDVFEVERRLIEVDFPLRRVSEESVREKNIRHGHISTLHIWWARRPLAASRATALATLLPDDPERRDEFMRLVADVAPWDVVSDGNGTRPSPLIEKARRLIQEALGGGSPRVLDCFAGGGAIPLEALRLGCETYACDYNPVAVLNLKAVLEYPQKFGQLVAHKDTPVAGAIGLSTEQTTNRLAEAMKRWGSRVLEETEKELQGFYPPDPDGSVPIGYIWARTIPCQNPACGAQIPLMRQTWLAKKEDKRTALRLVPNRLARRIDVEIVSSERLDFDPDEGTVSRARIRCPACGGMIDDKSTRRLFQEGKSGQRLMAVILARSSRTGKRYRLPNESDLRAYDAAEAAVERVRQVLWAEWGIDPVPDEPLPLMSGVFNVPLYGITRWGDLFNARQKLALMTFAEKVRDAFGQMLAEGGDPELAKATITYLALALDRLADQMTVLVTWLPTIEAVSHTFVRQALPITWDWVEPNPLSRAGASFISALDWEERVIKHCSRASSVPAIVTQSSATTLPYPDNFFDAVLTDPPYYINVPYADLSDFFYVWLKRTLGTLHGDLFAAPLSPKSEEIGQMAHWDTQRYGQKDKGWFQDMLTKAFGEISRILKPDGVAVIVFAYPNAVAWEAVINAIMNANLYLTASWPIHTERQVRMRAKASAALASSIYMVCRKRITRDVGDYANVRREIDERVRQKLAQFWDEGIRGADFFMSAIAPAVEVFGKYVRVEKQSGQAVTVAELLKYVRKVVSEFALQRILQSPELIGVDAATRFYLLFRWTYNHTLVPFDDARKLAQDVGIELTSLCEPGGLVEKRKGRVHAVSPHERALDERFARRTHFTSMIDALQRAAILWADNRQAELTAHLSTTYGGNEAFWQVAQAIAEVLPKGDKEKQSLLGLLSRLDLSQAASSKRPWSKR